MPPEVIVLAVASAVKPTSLAVVYTLMSGADPRRLLTVYLVAGALFSIAVGLAIVTVMNGAGVPKHESTAGAIVSVVAGVAALGFAAGIHAGRTRFGRERPVAPKPSPVVARLRHASPRMAALAGVATHPPGLFYLVALNAIAATNPEVVVAVVDVLVFNAIWFSGVIGSLVLFVLRPEATRAGLSRLESWSIRHQRGLTIVVSALAGAFLVVRGTVELVD